jgi:hypothetical protein
MSWLLYEKRYSDLCYIFSALCYQTNNRVHRNIFDVASKGSVRSVSIQIIMRHQNKDVKASKTELFQENNYQCSNECGSMGNSLLRINNDNKGTFCSRIRKLVLGPVYFQVCSKVLRSWMRFSLFLKVTRYMKYKWGGQILHTSC